LRPSRYGPDIRSWQHQFLLTADHQGTCNQLSGHGFVGWLRGHATALICFFPVSETSPAGGQCVPRTAALRRQRSKVRILSGPPIFPRETWHYSRRSVPPAVAYSATDGRTRRERVGYVGTILTHGRWGVPDGFRISHDQPAPSGRAPALRQGVPVDWPRRVSMAATPHNGGHDRVVDADRGKAFTRALLRRPGSSGRAAHPS